MFQDPFVTDIAWEGTLPQVVAAHMTLRVSIKKFVTLSTIVQYRDESHECSTWNYGKLWLFDTLVICTQDVTPQSSTGDEDEAVNGSGKASEADDALTVEVEKTESQSHLESKLRNEPPRCGGEHGRMGATVG